MSELHDVIRACPIREWLTRRLRAELPLLSGHKVILSYTLPSHGEPLPNITTQQINELWGQYISGGETTENIAENIRLQIVLETQIQQRQGEAARDLLEVMSDNLDATTALLKLIDFAESLLMTEDEAIAFGWSNWMERVHRLYCPGD